MKIAIGQIQILAERLQDNYLTIEQNVLRAKEQNAHLILFPEMALTGYFIGDAWERSAFLKEAEQYHEKIAKLADGIDIVFGSVGIDWNKKNEDGRVRKYNALFHASQGKLVKNSKTSYCFWPKVLLPNYREFDDSRHFYDLRKLAFEKNCTLIDLYEPLRIKVTDKEVYIGPTICEDAWSTDYGFSPIEIFASKYHHDFFINLSCSPFTKGKREKRDRLFTELVDKVKIPLVYINCVGIQNVGKTVYGFDGSSTYYALQKEPVAVGNFFADSLVMLDDKLTKRDDIDNVEETRIALEYILKNCLREWGIQKVVLGVSGGIDSALSAVLFSRVLPKGSLYLVNMPSRFNSNLTQDAAQKLAQNLECPYASVPIEKSIEYTKMQLDEVSFQNSLTKINVLPFAFENIQARDRGARILAGMASALQAVFPCNANKTELTVGYSTLYGDMAGFLCPIADLWKHDVYALAQHYNTQIFKKEIIPEATIKVTPSAELSAEQDVLQKKGDPLFYSYHDYLFRAWVEHWERKTPADCIEAYQLNTIDNMLGCEQGLTQKLFPTLEEFKTDLLRWWKLYQSMGSFKRMQAPPVIALTRRAFGFDHRENIKTNID